LRIHLWDSRSIGVYTKVSQIYVFSKFL